MPVSISYWVFLLAGLICLGLGVSLSTSAAMFPEYEDMLERWGGNIFVGGLVLVGFGFPFV
jgi:hypothetical protein